MIGCGITVMIDKTKKYKELELLLKSIVVETVKAAEGEIAISMYLDRAKRLMDLYIKRTKAGE